MPARNSEQKAFWIYYLLALMLVIAVLVGAEVFLKVARSDSEPFDFERELVEALHEQGLVDVNVPALVRIALRRPIYWLVILYAAAPTIAAVVVSAWRGGRRAVIQLFARLLPWLESDARNRALVCYAWIIGLHLLLIAVLMTASWILGGTQALERVEPRIGFGPAAFLVSFFMGTFLREGGALEELGWRGFGLPTLLRGGMTPLSASILLGVLWAAWHLPRDIVSVMQTQDVGSYLWSFSQFLTACVCLSILMTWCFHLTAGSALPAVMIHCLFVHVSHAFALQLPLDPRIPFFLPAALFAIGWTRGKLGSGIEHPHEAAAPG